MTVPGQAKPSLAEQLTTAFGPSVVAEKLSQQPTGTVLSAVDAYWKVVRGSNEVPFNLSESFGQLQGAMVVLADSPRERASRAKELNTTAAALEKEYLRQLGRRIAEWNLNAERLGAVAIDLSR
ncbi:MAG: hypothetical protein Q8L48_36800 [Archangium sp.]|nr:hypothetical protein [Archangium sp.]